MNANLSNSSSNVSKDNEKQPKKLESRKSPQILEKKTVSTDASCIYTNEHVANSNKTKSSGSSTANI